MPMSPNPYLRRSSWRDRFRFPKVHEGREWLAGFFLRAAEGIPPVTEGEFRELAAWFDANANRLARMTHPSCLLALGGGRETTVATIRYGLWQGPRALGVGELAADLRRVRANYGGEA
jgi:hypothetical protein